MGKFAAIIRLMSLAEYTPYLPKESDADALIARTLAWSNINSGSRHIAGLARMAEALWEPFSAIAENATRTALAPQILVDEKGNKVEQPLGDILRFRTRPNAPKQILLVGHYDTVFGEGHPFQTAKLRADGMLHGPGVADLKGGLSIMHAALAAFEQCPWKDEIGWEVILNPDEEIGSPGSGAVLMEAAKPHHLGMVFEPALIDGTLVGARKGSGNFVWVINGKSAHAGREVDAGRNAILAASEMIAALQNLHRAREEFTVNVGVISGGSVVNMVPDLAIVRFNVRLQQPEDGEWFLGELTKIEAAMNAKDGFSVTREGGFTRPPKPMTNRQTHAFEMVRETAAMLDIAIAWKDSGGVCDGNNLAAAGLPNVDTLGVHGANLHSAEEIAVADSFIERAQLATLMLMRIARGELALPA